MLEWFQTVNSSLWEDSLYQWFFYLGVLLVLLYECRKSVRVIFGFYPLTFYLFLFNPFSYWLITRIFTWDLQNYYRRFFAMAPLMYCTAWGFTEMVRRLRGIRKMAIVAFFAAFLMVTGNCIYTESWIQQRENIAKVPTDVLELSWILNNEGEAINVAVPESLSTYVRQVNPNLLTPYGRTVNELGVALSDLSRSVDFIMTEAGKQSVDYVVIPKSDEMRAKFSEAGYEPFNKTTNYLIYEVSGVPRVQRTLNSLRQIVEITTLDANGKPIPNSKGYTTIKYEYDRNGNRNRECYFDAEGNPYALENGIAGYAQTRSLSGVLQSETQLDIVGDPINVNGYATVKKEYSGGSRNKMLKSESYFDNEGNPVNRKDKGYASIVYYRDSLGNVVEERTYDESGNLSPRTEGYSIIRRTYNGANQVLTEFFYDKSNNPIDIGLGYSKIVYEYDAQGQQLKRYYNKNSESVPCGSANFHDFLAALSESDDVTTFLSICDEGTGALTETLFQDLRALGIQSDLHDKYRYSYYAVISPYGVWEDSSPDQTVSLEGNIAGVDYSISSSGWYAGNNSSIIIDGIEYSKNLRGMNIVVVKDGTVLESVCFDTCSTEMKETR